MADYDDLENTHDDDDSGKGGGAAGAIGAGLVGLVLLILFLPAAILSLVLFSLLTKGRNRASVIITLLVLPLEVICCVLLYRFDWSSVDLLGDWTTAIYPMVLLNLIVGGIGGSVLIVAASHYLRKTPYATELENNRWMTGFKYRRTPLEFLKLRSTIKDLKNGKLSSDKRIPLGYDLETDDVVYKNYEDARLHQCIIGGTGSGKTISMLQMMLNDIKYCYPLIYINFKPDPETTTKLAAWAKDYDRDFFHFSGGKDEDYNITLNESGHSTYDPLKTGSYGAKANMMLNTREYSQEAEFYKNNMQELLQILFNAIESADRSKAPSIDWDNGSIIMLDSILDGDNMTELAEACVDTDVYDDIRGLNAKKSQRGSGAKSAYDSLQGTLSTILNSEYGRWLQKYDDNSHPDIDLMELTHPDRDSSAVIVFDLPADSEPDFARFIGSLIIADITNLSSRRREANIKNQVSVYIDEFQAVTPTTVAGLLEKARASYLAVTLSLQNLDQVIQASGSNGEANLKSILNTVSGFVIHAGSTYDSAERLAGLIGKETSTVYMASVDNENMLFRLNFFNRRKQNVRQQPKEDWIVPPSEFMKLSLPKSSNGWKATAALISKGGASSGSGTDVSIARMIPNDEVLKSIAELESSARAVEGEEKTISPELRYNPALDLENIDNDFDDDYEEIKGGEFSFDDNNDSTDDSGSVVEKEETVTLKKRSSTGSSAPKSHDPKKTSKTVSSTTKTTSVKKNTRSENAEDDGKEVKYVEISNRIPDFGVEPPVKKTTPVRNKKPGNTGANGSSRSGSAKARTTRPTLNSSKINGSKTSGSGSKKDNGNNGEEVIDLTIL